MIHANVPHTDGCRTLAEHGGICGRLPDGTPCCVAEGHAPDPVPLEERVRHEVRAKHADCDPKVCPLARVWADDVREIIEVADRIRRDQASDMSYETAPVQQFYRGDRVRTRSEGEAGTVTGPAPQGPHGEPAVNIDWDGDCGGPAYEHDLRPDTGGRDLTIRDLNAAYKAWDDQHPGWGDVAGRERFIPEYLNRIARGDAGSAGDDTAPPAEHDGPRERCAPECSEQHTYTPGECLAATTPTAADVAEAVRLLRNDMDARVTWFRLVRTRAEKAAATIVRARLADVTASAEWLDRVHSAQDTVGRFLDDSRLAHLIGQDMRDALVVLSSDAHHRYAPTYPQPIGQVPVAAAGPRAGDTAPDDEAPAVPQDVARRWRKERDEAREAASAFRSDAAALRDAGNALARTASGAASVLDNGGEQMTADDLRGDLDAWRSAAGPPTTETGGTL